MQLLVCSGAAAGMYLCSCWYILVQLLVRTGAAAGAATQLLKAFASTKKVALSNIFYELLLVKEYFNLLSSAST